MEGVELLLQLVSLAGDDAEVGPLMEDVAELTQDGASSRRIGEREVRRWAISSWTMDEAGTA